MNDNPTDESVEGSQVSATKTHRPVYGSESRACRFEDLIVYDGGYEIVASPIPDMTYRVFQFKSDAERQLALADTRNEGLKYSKTFTSENGCDSEDHLRIQAKQGVA